MSEFEYGIVIHFDDRSGREFGFLEVVDEYGRKMGDQVFFHYNDGQRLAFPEFDHESIEFIGRVSPEDGCYLRHPKIGDKVVFRRKTRENGKSKAYPWTYRQEYDDCLSVLKNPRYRVTRVSESATGDPLGASTVIWEGRGAAVLSGIYSVQVVDDRVVDPLSSVVDTAAGITTHFRIEEWHEADSEDHGVEGQGVHIPAHWRPCSDPRRHSDAVLRLIEA